MTLAQIRNLVRTLLYSVDRRADVDQNTLNVLLDGINKSLWLRAVKAAQTIFTVYSDVTVPSNTEGKYDLATLPLASAGLHRVVRVELFTTNGNRIPLDPIYVNDRAEFEQPSVIATSLEPSAWFTLRGASSTSEDLFLVPKPSRQVTLRIYYVPNLADWTTDTTEPLAGHALFAPMHMLIAIEAAISLGATNLGALRETLNTSFNDTIRKRHGQGARKAHYEPYE